MIPDLAAVRQLADATPPHAQDSLLVESPLPGGVATVVRFLLQTVPQWLQIGGFIVGVLFALGIAVYLWSKRELIVGWVLTRSRGIKIALVSAAVLVVVAAAGAGTVSWNYMQHDNGFCTGCHIMGPAFQRFTASEHDTLSCHDCHQQSIFASMRQLYLWVAERPEEIGAHSPVPNQVCESCHVTEQPELWQRVAATAGHRTHLESDSSTLRDVMCVTCHGQEVHRFAPVDSTCAQADCHVDVEITIGKMQNQTTLHCVTCHHYTVEVPALATRDSAAGTLVPGMEQCFSCHEMRAILADFDPAFDPHRGTCGMCHNPHEQVVARDANATCATAQCHIDWRGEPFHIGTRHFDVGQQCTLCHEPHRARVDASDCQGCHAGIAERPDVPRNVRQRLQRVAPFDTARALPPQTSLPAIHRPYAMSRLRAASRPRGKGDVPPPAGPRTTEAVTGVSVRPLPPDTFSHDQHARLSCLTCHQTRSGHGGLTFAAPRGCQICHHQAPATSECAACHQMEELAPPLPATVTVAVEGHPPRERGVDLAHGEHGVLQCVDCHTAPVTLQVTTAIATCTDCHDDHHAAERTCVSCHAAPPGDTLHAPPADAHRWCDECHVRSTVALLLPDRAFCLTCHTADGDHYPDKTCTGCHLQTSPEEYRHSLIRTGAGS